MASYFIKYKITFIYFLSLIVVAGVSIIIIFTTKDNNNKDYKRYQSKKRSDNNSTEREIKNNGLIVLKNDTELIKPNIKMNAEFELVQMANNMTGLLISDPYATDYNLQIMMNYGSIIDTVPGISHFGEHMNTQGSEKYNDIIDPIFHYFLGIKGFGSNAFTDLNFQSYYLSMPFNYLIDKALDIFIDVFRYPLYSPDIIKKEIQSVNHEFYDRINEEFIEEDIIRQLSNNKTSFNGFKLGNNETLKVNETESLSKKLKGYHNVIKNPNNLFFVLYSNKTMNESKEYALKYLNYTMHEFPDDEIDLEDQKQLKENIYNVENVEIFDETLYKHGIYYNSNYQRNLLKIYYYTGQFESKELKFDIVDYYNYLFNSKSLLQILKSRSYIVMNERLSIKRDLYLKNNDYFYLTLILTEEGLKEINNIILIINKYIELMKEEGYKQEYFNNFVHYINNQNIFNFKKENILVSSYYTDLEKYYQIFGVDKILLGKLSEEDYDENLLKNHLNNIKYEKSFYSVNSVNNITELDFLDEVLKYKETKIVKYFNKNYIIGLIPDDLEEKINDNSYKIDNLKIREINSYFSQKYNEEVIPCYKEQINNCKEKNEFDYEKEDKYSGTQLEEDNEFYQTYYQMDKSSESHLVKSHLEININDLLSTDSRLSYSSFIETYINNILKEYYEIEGTINFPTFFPIMTFDFITFSDNTEKILNNFIDTILKTPEEDDIEYLKLLIINSLSSQKKENLESYMGKIYTKFITKKNQTDSDYFFEEVNNLNYTRFKEEYSLIFNNINLVTFKIAGNIDKNLVQNIHNHFKEKLVINKNKNKIIYKKKPLKNSEEYYVINYYQKSILDEPSNGIKVSYFVPEDYRNYMELFKDCFDQIAFQYLRFNYTNTYTPNIHYNEMYFEIYEQGVFKDVDKMEDDINKVLLDVIEGKINLDNYKEIIESLSFIDATKEEKTFDNLFNVFISDQDDASDKSLLTKVRILETTEKEETNNEEEEDNKKKEEEEKEREKEKEEGEEEVEKTEDILPKTFSELVEKVAPVFTNPKRITILIAGNYMSDENFKEMYERRKTIKEYPLNKNIEIIHTDDIYYSFDF